MLLSAIVVAALGGCAGGPRAGSGSGAEAAFPWSSVEVRGRSLAVLDFGPADARLTLLGVHGWAGSAAEFAPLAAALPRGLRLVAADFPGTGASQPADDDRCTTDEFVSVLRSLVERMGCGPLVLMGHSLGGKIAAVLAARVPEMVSGLVLVAPYGLSKQESALQRAVASRRWLAEAGARLNNRWAIQLGLGRVYHDRALAPEPIVEHVIASQLTPEGRRALAAVSHAMIGIDPIDELLPSVTQPTLLLWGRDDRVLRPQAAARYAALMPQARLRLLDRCGHVPMTERPHETAALLADFLRASGLLRE